MAIFTVLAGIGTAIGSFIGGLGVVGSFLLKTAVGVGLNLLASAIAGKPEKPTFSINGTLQGGGDLPRSFILGKTATAGSLVWANTWGKDGDTPNAYLTQVIALSDLPIKGITGMWVNNEPVTISSTVDEFGSVIPEYTKDGNRNLWVRIYDGTQTAADSLLVSRASNSNRYWPATRVGRGVAYVVVTARVSKQMFSGIPNFKFEVDGARLYDPSKDSTNGGSGTQRHANPATWGGDGDYLPAVQAYNLLRGLKYGNEWFYGVQGMSAARLPSDNWIKAINKCRQQIASADGMVPQFRSGGEVTIDAPLSIAMEAINATCMGKISEIGGTYQMFVGAPDAPVISFTDDDIISTNEQSFTPFFGLADTINGISATYPSPADGWVVKTAPPLYRTDLEARHGNRRLMAAVEMTFSPFPEQVQRLMKAALDEGQRARRHTIVLPPKFWAYATPGTVFSWTSKRNGYVNKLMRIDGVVDNPNLDVMVDMTEVDPSDYNWNSSTDYKPPIDGAVGPLRPQPQPIIDFSAIPAVSKDANGNDRRPAILLGWDGDKTAVDLVRFEVRQSWDLAVVYTGRTEEVSRGSILIAPFMLQANSIYQVRARYAVYDDSRDFIWSDWIPVHMLDIRLGELDIYPIDIDELNKDVIAYQDWVGGSLRYVQEELDRIGAWATEQEAGNFRERQIIRTEVKLTADNITASYERAVAVVITDVMAVSSRVESLEVKVNEDIAKAVDLLNSEIATVDGRVTANANAITALSTTVNNVSADATFRMGTVASPSGWSSRIAFQARVGTSDNYKNSGIYLDATTTSSRVVIDTEQFVVRSGNDYARPLMFQNGVLYADEMRVAWAKITNVQVTSAQIADAAITSAKIGHAEIKTSNLDFNQVTQLYDNEEQIPNRSGWNQGTYDYAAITTDNPQGNTCMVECDISKIFKNEYGSGGQMVRIGVFNKTTNQWLQYRQASFSGQGTQGEIAVSQMVFDANAAQGVNEYVIRMTITGGNTNYMTLGNLPVVLKVMVWKR